MKTNLQMDCTNIWVWLVLGAVFLFAGYLIVFETANPYTEWVVKNAWYVIGACLSYIGYTKYTQNAVKNAQEEIKPIETAQEKKEKEEDDKLEDLLRNLDI